MSSPLFSVIIPTYGRPQFLEEAIDSVLAQNIDDFECIVVDDASPDPVQVPTHPRVRLVRRHENGGASAARNTGLEHALGRYVTFLDDDDLYTKDRLALGMEGLQGGRRLSLCWLGTLNAPTEHVRLSRTLNGNVSAVIVENRVPHVGLATIDRDSVLPFDERFTVLNDVEWWVRTTLDTEVSTVPRIGYMVRRHDLPRLRSRGRERLNYRMLLLATHPDYFADRPRAAAYQWKRVGGRAQCLGDLDLARAAFWRSLRLHPSATTAWRLLRCLPSRRVRSSVALTTSPVRQGDSPDQGGSAPPGEVPARETR